MRRLALTLAAAIALAGCGAPARALAPAPQRPAAVAAGTDALDYAAIFRVLDRDRNAALAPAELELNAAQFAAFDRDGNGSVSAAEWLGEADPTELERHAAAFTPIEEAARKLGGAPIGTKEFRDRTPRRGIGRWFLDRYLALGSRIAMQKALYNRNSKIYSSPAQFGLAYENVAFDTEDDLTLKGWYIPAGRETDKAIILLHGHESQRGEFVRDGQIAWLHPDYHQLAIDMRHNGESEGDITSFGLHEGKDVLAAIKYLKARGIRHMAVYGVSMGGATAIRAAALTNEIELVVNDCAFATMLSGFKGFVSATHAPYSTLIAAALLTRANKALNGDMTTTEPVTQVKHIAPRPFMVIHGEADPLVTWDNSVINYEAAGAGLVKDLWIVPGAGHGQSMVHARAAYRDRVLAFLKQNF